MLGFFFIVYLFVCLFAMFLTKHAPTKNRSNFAIGVGYGNANYVVACLCAKSFEKLKVQLIRSDLKTGIVT